MNKEMSWNWVLYQELEYDGPDMRLVCNINGLEWSIKQMTPSASFWLFLNNKKVYDSESINNIFNYIEGYRPIFEHSKPKLKKPNLTIKSTWDTI